MQSSPSPQRTSTLWSQKIIWILLGLELLLVAASAVDHGVNGDEAWLGEQAYFKAKDGYVHSNFFKGFNHQEEQIVVYHRLFISTASSLFNLLGFSLTTLRLIPILSGLVLLFLLWYFCRKRLKMPPAEIAFVLLIFLMIPQAFYFIKIARPEMMVTVFGFASFILLFRDDRSDGWLQVIVAGLCAGAAMMAHLNGAIFIGSGVILLAIEKRYLPSIVFGLAATVVLTPYIIDISANFELFILQMTNPYVASKTQVGFFTPLVNLANEHQRLFRKPEIILPMCLFLIALLYRWKHADANRKFLRTYCIVLMILLGMLVEDKTVKYSTYLAPFWAIIVVDAIPMLFSKKGIRKTAAAILIVGFTGFSIYYQSRDIANKEQPTDLNATIGSFIPDSAWCVASGNFMFDEIERLNVLSNELVRLETRNQPTADNLAAFCDRKQASYLVFNKYGERIDDISDFRTNRAHVLSLFDIIVENKDFTVLRRKSEGGGSQMH